MGPGEPAADGGGRYKAGHDDRDRVLEQLKTAFTQGRLTTEELDARSGQALAARTYADLNALTEDIPGVPRAAFPPDSLIPAPASMARPSAPAAGWRLLRASAISAGCLGLAFVAVYSGNLIDNSWDGPGPGPDHGWTRLLLLLAYVAVITAFVVMGHAIGTTLQERNARRRGPGAG